MATTVLTNAYEFALSRTGRKDARNPVNGVRWKALSISQYQTQMYYSLDDGATWVASTVINTGLGAFFIDKDGFAHHIGITSNGYHYYQRGVPNGGTSWAWSGTYDVIVGTTNSTPDLTVVRNPTGGWLVFISQAYSDASTTRLYRFEIPISASGTIGTPTGGQIASSTRVEPNAPWRANVDFNHTGDGVTEPSSAITRYDAYHTAANRIDVWDNTAHTLVNDGAYYGRMDARWDGLSRFIVAYVKTSANTAVGVSTMNNTGVVTSIDPPALNAGQVLGVAVVPSADIVHLFAGTATGLYYSKQTTAGWGAWQQLETEAVAADSLSASRGPNSVYLSYMSGTTVRDLVVSLNVAPNAPTLALPANGAVLNLEQAQTFTWQFNDPDTGDSQSAYNFAYRPIGATSWIETGWVASTSSQHIVPAGTFTAGDYEWRVATKDSQGELSPWSTIGFFTASTPPPGPIITNPINGGTISGEEYPVEWSAPNQDAYRLRVLDGTTVVYDTGQVNTTTARSRLVAFPDNGVTRVIELSIMYGLLWSPASTVTVTVSYTPPSIPLVTVTPVDVGIGMDSAIRISASHPQDTGTPSVIGMDVWIREVGRTDEIRIARDAAPNLPVTWHEPTHGVMYEARVQAIGDNGTSTFSLWTQASGPVSIRNFLLHDPSAPLETLHWFRYNDTGATDALEVENTLTQYTGRTYPVAEFGEAETRAIEIPLIQSDYETYDDWSALVTLIRRKAVLCYRDSRGRKVFGVATTNSAKDVHYGQETSLVITATDYTEGA